MSKMKCPNCKIELELDEGMEFCVGDRLECGDCGGTMVVDDRGRLVRPPQAKTKNAGKKQAGVGKGFYIAAALFLLASGLVFVRVFVPEYKQAKQQKQARIENAARKKQAVEEKTRAMLAGAKLRAVRCDHGLHQGQYVYLLQMSNLGSVDFDGKIFVDVYNLAAERIADDMFSGTIATANYQRLKIVGPLGGSYVEWRARHGGKLIGSGRYVLK